MKVPTQSCAILGMYMSVENVCFLLVRPYLSIFRMQQFEQCLRAIFFYFLLNYEELWANRIHLGSESVFFVRKLHIVFDKWKYSPD